MKFIISTLSPSMFIESDFDLRWHKLSEDEFQALILDAYSCVGYEDVATMINVAYKCCLMETWNTIVFKYVRQSFH